MVHLWETVLCPSFISADLMKKIVPTKNNLWEKDFFYLLFALWGTQSRTLNHPHSGCVFPHQLGQSPIDMPTGQADLGDHVPWGF